MLVAAPHYSLLDAFFFGYYEAPSAISKAAVKHIPIIGTLLAIPVLGEIPSGLQIAGIGLIIAGLFVAAWRRSPRPAA